jgi:diketogulonate reductase-like aldo/keto reductase
LTPAQLDYRRGIANLAKFRGGVNELPEATAGETAVASSPSGAPTIDLPRIGIGTYRWNGALGGRIAAAPFIDTAETYGYGRVETALGRHPLPARVATKVSRSHMSANALRAATERSLSKLGLDRIWLQQIHWPVLDMSPARDALLELREHGKIQHWGVCNFAVSQIEPLVMAGCPPATVQVRYNLLEREIEGFLLPYCRERGIGVIGYSPLGQGWRRYRRPILGRLAGELGITEAQVALGWVMSRGVVPIPATNDPGHLLENLAARPLDPDAARRCEVGYA